MPQHTPGPWEAIGTNVYPANPRTRTNRILASVENAATRNHAVANARLIAAAPAMLEALERCLEVFQLQSLKEAPISDAIALTRKAIKMAIGDS